MASRTKSGGGRNVAPSIAMASPYATELMLHSAAALGTGATAAAMTGAAGATAYGVARHRESPSKRARRDLRKAARSAPSGSGQRSRGARTGGGGGQARRSVAGTGGAKRGAGVGSKGSTAASKHGAAGGKSGSKGGGKGGTGLLDKKATGSPSTTGARSTSARSGSSGTNRRGGSGTGAPFGHGPRGSAARSQFGGGKSNMPGKGKGSGKGGSKGPGKTSGAGLLSPGGKSGSKGGGKSGGLLRGGGKAPKGSTSRRGGGLSALGSSISRAARSVAGRRSAARSAGARTRQRQPKGAGRQQWGRGSRAGRTVAKSWGPVGRLWGRQRHAGLLPAAIRGGHLLARSAVALVGSTVGIAMYAPKLVRAHRSLGLALGRRIQIARSAMAAWMNPYEHNQYERLLRTKIKPYRNHSGGGSTQGGNDMSETADHVEALIEQVRSAATIDREQVSGVGAAAHAEAMGRLLDAVAEWAGSNLDVLREGLPQLDGGESLTQQASVITGAADAARECSNQFEAVHEDRLRRQRDPEAGEEAWDVSAAQD